MRREWTAGPPARPASGPGRTNEATVTDSPLVYFVVLNYRNFSDTIECVRSVEKIDYPNYRVVIVDNGSDNESETVLAETFPRHMVIQAGRNGGYAAGNNVGIRRAIEDGADFFLILNNDTVVAPDFLSELVNHALENPEVGLLGPLILQSDGTVYDPCVRRRPRLRDILWYMGVGHWFGATTDRHQLAASERERSLGTPREVDVISGACMLLRASLVEEIGLLDENTFLFAEEFILHEKIRGTRYKTVMVPRSRIVHKAGRSVKTVGARTVLAYLQSLDYYLREYRNMGFVLRLTALLSAVAKLGPGALKSVVGYRKLRAWMNSRLR